MEEKHYNTLQLVGNQYCKQQNHLKSSNVAICSFLLIVKLASVFQT